MGGGPSKEHALINEDESNRRYQQILQNFVFEKKCSDKIYGNISVYLYKNSNNPYRLAEIAHSYPSEAGMDNAFQTFYNIMETAPCNRLQLHMCRKSVEDSLCSIQYKVYTLFDYIQETLEDIIQERAKTQNQFKEAELWSLLEQLIQGISIIEDHKYLRTDTIFVVNQFNGEQLYKVFYRNVLNFKTNYEDCQKGIFTGRYLTISGLDHLKEQSETYSDTELQDKFALGMVILSAAILENLDSCYDYHKFEMKHTILQEKFTKMKQSYSENICSMVQQLLQDDQGQGLNIKDLNEKFMSFQLPCGPRKVLSYQSVNLECLPQIMDNPSLVQNPIIGNNSMNIAQNNNMVGNALNQSLNNGAIQGNFIGANDIIHHQQDQNQLFNNSPKNNLQNGSQQYGASGVTGSFNQFPQQQLQHQHTLSNPEAVMHNNLISSIVHNPYGNGLVSPQQNNNIFNQPLTNTINLNNPNQGGGLVNQYSTQSQGNPMYNPNINSLTHSPNLGAINGANYNTNNNLYPQIQLNTNNVIPQQNNMGGQMGMNNQMNAADLNTGLIQLLLQVSQQLQQQQQQQQLQESFYQNTSQMTYSPLRGAQIFNQFNQKKQYYADNQSELNKSYSAMNGIPRRKTTFQYEDGSLFDGEMVLDYRDGYGKLVFSNKGVYEGTWKMNKMHGKGILYYPNGDIAYEGDWFEDQFNNFGHLYNSKAQHTKQKFDFKDFTLIKNYWLKYEGEFTLDRKQGFGTLYFTNGERYSGNFKNDQIHGYGVYHQADGESFSGYWEENLLIKRM